MKLTKAQRELLAGNEMVSVSSITGNVWANDGRFSVKVRRSTFDALLKAGMYLPHAQNGQTIVYSRTVAGRAALSETQP